MMKSLFKHFMSENEKQSENEAEQEPEAAAVATEAEPTDDSEAPASKAESAGEQDGLLKQLDEVQARAKEYEDRFLRALAEQENFRKRAVREKEELRKYATSALIEDLLPVVDHLAIGLESARSHPEAAAVTDGFAMVFSQFQGVFERHGVVELDPLGDDFDPNVHESIAHQPNAEVEEGKVMAVTRKGYKIHDRLLRPASVVVSSGAPDEEAPSE